MKYRLILFAASFVFLVVFSASLGPRSASAQKPPEVLKRTNFRPNDRANINRYRLSDGDVIMITVEEDKGIAQDQIEIVLKTDPNITWWKSIVVKEGITKSDGSFGGTSTVNSIEMQDDDHGPKAMRLHFDDVKNT